jgi:hypothetical protein
VLSVSSYNSDYVERCRQRVAKQLESYQTLVASSAAGSAVAAFEAGYFASQILALDHYFDHRARGQEGKDGNALNELRVICNSLMAGSVLVADSQIRLDPTRSVLGLKTGDEIAINADGFARLAAAVFAEIEKRYP